jgi:hypothetical protein
LLEAAVVADGSLSNDEVEHIRKVVDAFGEEEYRKLVDEVARRFQSRDDLMNLLETIQRPEARDLIYGFFLAEAAGEGLRGREFRAGRLARRGWQLDVKIDDGESR